MSKPEKLSVTRIRDIRLAVADCESGGFGELRSQIEDDRRDLLNAVDQLIEDWTTAQTELAAKDAEIASWRVQLDAASDMLAKRGEEIAALQSLRTDRRDRLKEALGLIDWQAAQFSAKHIATHVYEAVAPVVAYYESGWARCGEADSGKASIIRDLRKQAEADTAEIRRLKEQVAIFGGVVGRLECERNELRAALRPFANAGKHCEDKSAKFGTFVCEEDWVRAVEVEGD